eukprot:TRINITY_DN2668_c0_g1_i1.p2 TRINITY_DN2668_c0_g1~~TRINITY_DN2668_c0_g1_i1.p2  ORF type:complete len:160 (+),score=11.94 TRINITY_DN2668_c0_g1_i1:572-1051(+)
MRPFPYVGTDSVLMLASGCSLASLEHIRSKWWPEALHHTGGAQDTRVLLSIAVVGERDRHLAVGDQRRGTHNDTCQHVMQQVCAWGDAVEAKGTPPLRVVPRFVFFCQLQHGRGHTRTAGASHCRHSCRAHGLASPHARSKPHLQQRSIYWLACVYLNC